MRFITFITLLSFTFNINLFAENNQELNKNAIDDRPQELIQTYKLPEPLQNPRTEDLLNKQDNIDNNSANNQQVNNESINAHEEVSEKINKIKQEQEDSFKKMYNFNYKIHPSRGMIPNENYLSGQNKHIPPFVFKSYYIKLMFDSIENDDINAVRYFLLEHKLLYSKNPESFTPLQYAAYNESINVARLLLKFGADVNEIGSYGKSPLHIAVENNDYAMCKLLLTMGASPNVRDTNGLLPIDYIYEGNANIYSLLNSYNNLIPISQ